MYIQTYISLYAGPQGPKGVPQWPGQHGPREAHKGPAGPPPVRFKISAGGPALFFGFSWLGPELNSFGNNKF